MVLDFQFRRKIAQAKLDGLRSKNPHLAYSGHDANKILFSQVLNDFFFFPSNMCRHRKCFFAEVPRISGNNYAKIEIYVNVYVNNNAMKYMVIVSFILF